MPKPNKFDGMMHEYCVKKGYCGSIIDGQVKHVTDYIPAKGLVSADDFVNWLLIAEGLDPDYNSAKSDLIKTFVKHMGANNINATNLR